MSMRSKLESILASEMAIPENDDDLESVRVEDANRSKANTGILFSIKKAYYTWKREFNLKKYEKIDKKIDETSDNFVISDNYSEELAHQEALRLYNLSEKREEAQNKADQAQSKLDELNASVETKPVEETTKDIPGVETEPSEETTKDIPGVETEPSEETTKDIPDVEINQQKIEQSLEGYADREAMNEGTEPAAEQPNLNSEETQEEIKPIPQETLKNEDPTQSEIIELKKQHEQDKKKIDDQFQTDLSNLIASYVKNSRNEESDFYSKSFDLIYAQANNLVIGLQKDLANTQSKNSMLQANLDKAEQMVQNQDATIKEQASAINGLNDSIAAKEKENAALRLEIEKKDSTIKSLNSIVSGFQALNMVETDEYTSSKGKTK